MKSFFGGIIGGLFGVGVFAFGMHTYQAYWEEDASSELDLSWTENDLRKAFVELEGYRSTFGFYPHDLEDAVGPWGVQDSLLQSCDCSGSRDFFYLASDGQLSYQLFSKGRDCEPFTEDDVHPEVSPEELVHSGLQAPEPQLAVSREGACNDT
jgi:hypothetical protein